MTKTISVRDCIAELGTSAIARAMGVGVSTVNGWKQADALPGGDRPTNRGLYEQRLKAFQVAVHRLTKELRKAEAKAKRAATRRRPAERATQRAA